MRPDFVIDDHPEPVEAFGGIHVEPTAFPLDGDTEMLRVYEAIRGYAN